MRGANGNWIKRFSSFSSFVFDVFGPPQATCLRPIFWHTEWDLLAIDHYGNITDGKSNRGLVRQQRLSNKTFCKSLSMCGVRKFHDYNFMEVLSHWNHKVAGLKLWSIKELCRRSLLCHHTKTLCILIAYILFDYKMLQLKCSFVFICKIFKTSHTFKYAVAKAHRQHCFLPARTP